MGGSDQAKQHQAPYATHTDKPVWTPEEAIAGSAFADEIALAQRARMQAGEPSTKQPPVAADRAGLIDTLDSTRALLHELEASVAPWQLGLQLYSTRFLTDKRAWVLSAQPEELAQWAPIFRS
ncbi:MAG: hypothetical protein H0T79_03000, partial [Deltaproteobacteria bacterium]|nr:hypothetical protein [Deltaproteobacteria bacterium]